MLRMMRKNVMQDCYFEISRMTTPTSTATTITTCITTPVTDKAAVSTVEPMHQSACIHMKCGVKRITSWIANTVVSHGQC